VRLSAPFAGRALPSRIIFLFISLVLICVTDWVNPRLSAAGKIRQIDNNYLNYLMESQTRDCPAHSIVLTTTMLPHSPLFRYRLLYNVASIPGTIHREMSMRMWLWIMDCDGSLQYGPRFTASAMKAHNSFELETSWIRDKRVSAVYLIPRALFRRECWIPWQALRFLRFL
jgi:hypothetical protein